MTEYAGGGDTRRSMELLWGVLPQSARGPKQGLRVEDIAASAIALADAEGLAAVSMRKVAESVGTSAMSLYTYFPAKSELFDLMIDTAYGELPTSFPSAADWRAAAEASARAWWGLFQRHPWLMQISVARALLGPNELSSYEANLAVFDGLGLDGQEMMWAAAALTSFVSGAASALADARAAEAVTGQSDDDWWYERSALLEEFQPADWNERHPVSARLDSEHVFEQPHRADDDPSSYMEREALDVFEFGLARLLDGIGALIASKKPKRRR